MRVSAASVSSAATSEANWLGLLKELPPRTWDSVWAINVVAFSRNDDWCEKKDDETVRFDNIRSKDIASCDTAPML